MRPLGFAALLLVSCSSEPAAPAQYLGEARSGTRLRPIVIKTEDGLRFPIGIHDSALGIDCAPRKTADGVLRCLPQTQGTGIETHVFADSACTKRAIEQDPGFAFVDGFAFVHTADGGGCEDRVQVFRVTQTHEMFSDASGSCVPVADHWPVYVIEGELPPTAFVDLAPVSSGRFAADTYDGSDGSRITIAPNAPRDASFGVPCWPGLAADDHLRCLPASVAATANFADATCSEVALQHGGCVPRPTFLREERPSRRAHIYDVGAPLDQTFVPRAGGTCVASDFPVPTFKIGPEIDPTAFAPVARTTFGDGQLAVRAFELDGRVFADPGAWIGGWFIDRATGETCDLFAIAKDNFRCAPTQSAASIVYRDEACSDPVALVSDPEHLPRIAYEFGGEFWQKAYEVLADVPREVKTFDWYGDECGDYGASKVLPLGRSIALNSFPRAYRVIE